MRVIPGNELVPHELPFEVIERLCIELNVAPDRVREIRFRAPRSCELVTYDVDENGAKRIDTATGGVRLQTFTVEIAARS